MKEKWPYYRRRLYFVLLAATFLLGFYSLYVYYRPIISRAWQLLSAVLYGTFKMFLYSPPLGVTADYHWTYEVAKWLAPILTSALVLTALTNRVLHLKNVILNSFGSHILIFGASKQSQAFLQSLKGRDNRFRKTLVSASALSDDAKQDYEKLGAAVYTEDVRMLTAKEREAFSKQVRLSRSEHILFMGDDEADNYQTFLSLLREIDPKEHQTIHLQIETPVLRRYVERALERRKQSEEKYRLLDLRFYSLAGLSIDRLLGQGQAVHFVQPLIDQLSPGDNFLDKLPPVHLFVLGANDLSRELLLRSVNDFVIGRDKIKLTLVDSSVTDFYDDLQYHYPQLSQALELEVHTSLPGRHSFDETARQGDYTALFLNHPNPLVNLQALEYFPPDIPVAFRNEPGLDLREIHKSRQNVIFYGDLSEIMTRQIVLQESLDQAARDFNQRYAEVASILGSGGQPWPELSPVKKQSSRLSAAHAFMKAALLSAGLGQSLPEVRATMARDKAKFNQLVATKQGEDFRDALVAYFRDKPYLEQLSELEHKRWVNSYYVMGFRRGDVKDEVQKTHPCMIEDWAELMGEAFFSCHPEYDLISALSLAGEDHETK